MERPLLAKGQVDHAKAIGAHALAHGCTGKGNDQVRFELAYQALAPDLEVIAPWRHWEIRSREDALDYADRHGIPVAASRVKIYSRDRNLWHISHEGGALESPGNAPPDDVWQLTVDPRQAPDQPLELTLSFAHGVPTALNGEVLAPVELVARLNDLGGRHGVGRVDICETAFRAYDSITRSVARRRGPVTDSTQADGWVTVRVTDGKWWVYARAINVQDPNAEWYWNVPLEGDTVRLGPSNGRARPRFK